MRSAAFFKNQIQQIIPDSFLMQKRRKIKQNFIIRLFISLRSTNRTITAIKKQKKITYFEVIYTVKFSYFYIEDVIIKIFNEIDQHVMEELIHQFVRIFQKFKIIFILKGNRLILKLFINQDGNNYYKGQFSFNGLPQAYKAIFNNLQEIINEFKAMKQEQVQFTKDFYFTYILPLATKKIQLGLPLQSNILNNEERLQAQNIVLKRIKDQYEIIIDERDEEIKRLISKVASLEQMMNGQKQWYKNKSPNHNYINNMKNYNNQRYKAAESSTNIKTETGQTHQNRQKSQHNQSYPLKRTNYKLWNQPSQKYHKNNDGKIERLTKLSLEQFNFFAAQNSKYLTKFQFELSHLKLIQNYPEDNGQYFMVASNPINEKGRTLIGLKLIKQSEKPIILGLTRCESGENAQQTLYHDAIVYDMKTGIMTIYIEANKTEQIQFVPVKQTDTLHISIDMTAKIFEWYHNEILIKACNLINPFRNSCLIPFIQMSVLGDEVEFL